MSCPSAPLKETQEARKPISPLHLCVPRLYSLGPDPDDALLDTAHTRAEASPQGRSSGSKWGQSGATVSLPPHSYVALTDRQTLILTTQIFPSLI